MGLRIGDRWKKVAAPLARRGWYAMFVGVVVVVAVLMWTSCSDAVSAAEDLVAEGDLAGAEATYREVLEGSPDDTRALDGLAVVLMWQQRYEEAAVVQELAAASDASNILVRVELGFNYLNHLDRPADAVRVFSEAAALEPTGKNLTFLAQAQIADDSPSEARSSLQRAIETDPHYPHSYVVLIGLLEMQHRVGEADQIRNLAADNGIELKSALLPEQETTRASPQ